MSKVPVIGISWQVSTDSIQRRFGNYESAIQDAGGCVRSISYDDDPAELANEMDGWLITGGMDIDAKHFGQEPDNNDERLVDERRYEIESRIYQSVQEELPILGICYGCQFINVQRGGNLVQHLPDDKLAVHRNGNLDSEHISILNDNQSTLHDLLEVNQTEGKSHHHQAISLVGANLKVVAMEPKTNVIEAIEATDRPWEIGVQWHPERSRLMGCEHDRLFRAFVAAAAAYRGQFKRVTAQ